MKNFTLLLAAYISSQGILFLVQSWLIAVGEVAYVGRFGLGFTFAVFAYYTVDWGGQLVLARRQLVHEQTIPFDQFLVSLFIARMIVAACLASLLMLWLWFAHWDFASAYIIGASPALAMATLNVGGVLDGRRRSGFAGLAAMPPVLFSAFALVFAAHLSGWQQGLVLGLSFSTGTMTTILCQYRSLGGKKLMLNFHLASRDSIRAAAKEGGIAVLAQLPSFAMYRIQIAICAIMLGPSATGVFVYGKQIINGMMQLVQLVSRAELPKIMSVFDPTEALTMRNLIKTQIGTIVAGGSLAMSVSLIGLALWTMRQDNFSTSGLFIACFGPALASGTVFLMLHQAHLARGTLEVAATISNLSALLGSGLALLGTLFLDIYGFALAEVLANCAGIAGMAVLSRWRRHRNA